jgi:hypothetical protein
VNTVLSTELNRIEAEFAADLAELEDRVSIPSKYLSALVREVAALRARNTELEALLVAANADRDNWRSLHHGVVNVNPRPMETMEIGELMGILKAGGGK